MSQRTFVIGLTPLPRGTDEADASKVVICFITSCYQKIMLDLQYLNVLLPKINIRMCIHGIQ